MQYSQGRLLKCWLVGLLVMCGFLGFSQVLRKRTVKLMGGRFDITIVAKDSSTAEQYIDTVIQEVSRIEYLISTAKTGIAGVTSQCQCRYPACSSG